MEKQKETEKTEKNEAQNVSNNKIFNKQMATSLTKFLSRTTLNPSEIDEFIFLIKQINDITKQD